GVLYADIGWEGPRVAILQEIESGAFFQKVQSGLIVDLYNQKEIWPLFGYEGESASKGGYINRGFNDLAWL
ncbi:MAG TPA: Twin-arginine translocation pathway signal, partial [Beijerinckia sp.]|nr:Twin-arginine translocation pathway signal [Beijerinckia sp.]